MNEYKGLHGYATRKEWLEAWNQHLDQMCHEARKTVVVQMFRKPPGRRMVHRAQVWPQLIPALDEMLRDGEVRVVGTRTYVEGVTTRSSTYTRSGA